MDATSKTANKQMTSKESIQIERKEKPAKYTNILKSEGGQTGKGETNKVIVPASARLHSTERKTLRAPTKLRGGG